MLQNLFSTKKYRSLRIHSLDLGDFDTKIPVFDRSCGAPGLTFLITAGMDGDEYTGIEAAYELIEEFEQKNFAGRLIIIPIVNTTGFEGECSQCPLDGKYPKNIFPGSAKGSPSDRVVQWLHANYVSQADVWLDMHSGAITEGLKPFLWVFKTGNDALTQKIVEYNVAQTIVVEEASWSSMQRQIGKHGCTYICAESGSRGGRLAEDVERHVDWAHSILELAQVSNYAQEYARKPAKIIKDISFLVAPFDGIWRPKFSEDGEYIEGSVVGTVCAMDGSHPRELRAPATGTGLWWKETMQMREGDVLLAIGQ